jgi:D-3-phosphoglycerate dehydrogenase / 2-oxoglutarate reductase
LNDGPQSLQKADVLIVRLKHLLDRNFLAQVPNLRIISTATTGLDHIDLIAAAERNVQVLSLRGEAEFLKGVTATAEHSWGLLLSLLRHIPQAHQSVVNGNWDRTKFFGRELQNRHLGIVGLGRIGQMVAQYGLAFRMEVRAYDPGQDDGLPNIRRAGTLKDLVRSADVLSLHVPLNERTRHLIDEGILQLMKPDAVLVNTSRGAIVDQLALLRALQAGQLAGAALDVVEDEYHSESSARVELLRYAASHHNLLITPHLGGATFDSLEKVEIFMAEKLAAHLVQKDR